VAVAVMARRWFLQHMDVELQARAAGVATAVPMAAAIAAFGIAALLTFIVSCRPAPSIAQGA